MTRQDSAWIGHRIVFWPEQMPCAMCRAPATRLATFEGRIDQEQFFCEEHAARPHADGTVIRRLATAEDQADPLPCGYAWFVDERVFRSGAAALESLEHWIAVTRKGDQSTFTADIRVFRDTGTFWFTLSDDWTGKSLHGKGKGLAAAIRDAMSRVESVRTEG